MALAKAAAPAKAAAGEFSSALFTLVCHCLLQ
jgi:hypothetical protein